MDHIGTVHDGQVRINSVCYEPCMFCIDAIKDAACSTEDSERVQEAPEALTDHLSARSVGHE